VGARVALAILTVLTPDELMPAIAAGDRAALARAAGVGTKLAARVLSELKDKVGDIALGQAVVGADAASGITADAVSALVNLGYGPTESYAAVSHAARRLGAVADVEVLIRAGLAELAPKEHRL
jgi:Holliday junction DNA helicase RuvA